MENYGMSVEEAIKTFSEITKLWAKTSIFQFETKDEKDQTVENQKNENHT